MKVIRARNVNDALLLGLDLFQDPRNFRTQESRNGVTYEALEPVTTVYERPWERVCLLKRRDANPFFHFIEGLWMLAGRNDLEPLTYFVKSMEDFSDDGETLWGAYGYRWLNHFGYSVGHDRNQIKKIINILRENPNDRRAVLQMWDAVVDLDYQGKDVPCNTNIYFKVRDEALQMTVCCRSNDMLWGAYGANSVHMSMLQEYMAEAIGVKIGTYRQISDSFHVYHNEVWERMKHLEIDPLTFRTQTRNPYDVLENPQHVPLITNFKKFHLELEEFFELFTQSIISDTNYPRFDQTNWVNPAFKDVGVPMLKAFKLHKERDYLNSYREVMNILPTDWMTACFDWIRKRDTMWSITKKEKTHG